MPALEGCPLSFKGAVYFKHFRDARKQSVQHPYNQSCNLIVALVAQATQRNDIGALALGSWELISRNSLGIKIKRNE